jgi:phosphoribosylanthranilate isomerase
MIGSITVKVCGITRAEDARAAAAIGADSLGFIFYPKSPRYVSLERFKSLQAELPAVRKVAVMVEPGLADLTGVLQAGFDAVQVHFKTNTPLVLVQEWSEYVGRERLWLAPKLPAGAEVSPMLFPLADTFLLDAFHEEKFGGTGQTGDWSAFARQQRDHPGKTWILSGGLNPGNVAAALAATGAKFIDVNSGVESAPGVKDHSKLVALKTALGNG